MWLKRLLFAFWVFLTFLFVIVGKWVYESVYHTEECIILTRKIPQPKYFFYEPEVKSEEKNVPELFEEARKYKLKEQFDLAIPAYQEILKIEPENQDARIGLGYSYLFLGELKSAYDQFSEVLKLNPKNFEAITGLGRIAAFKNDFINAEKYYQKSILIKPDDPTTLFYYGILKNQEGDKDKARDIFKRLYSINPSKEVKESYTKLDQEIKTYETPIKTIPFIEREIENLKGLYTLMQKKFASFDFEGEVDCYLSKGDHFGLTAIDWYRLSLLYIQKRNFEKAKISLSIAIEKDPCLTEAYVQLGYIYLWQNFLNHAEKAFLQALEAHPFEPFALEGLMRTGQRYSANQNFCDALRVFQYLTEYDPENVDFLFFLSLAEYRLHDYIATKRHLVAVLEKNSNYEDAVEILGNIYILGEMYESASCLFSQYLHTNAGRIGLAKVAMIKNNPVMAENLYREVLSENLGHVEARKGLIKALIAQRRYREAKKELSIVAIDPSNKDEVYDRDSFEVKSHTNEAVFYDFSYTAAKENDPGIKKPVVKNYYFLNSLNFLFPIHEHLRIDGKCFLYHQKENDIYPPKGVNYNVYFNGLQATSRYLFSNFWQWDCTLRGYEAFDRGNVFFPFKNTTSVEPGTYLTYNSPWEYFSTAAFYDSFIIKNFARVRSQILRTATLHAKYGRRFIDTCLHPEVFGWVNQTFIHDSLHNQRHEAALFNQFDVPYLGRHVNASYLVEYRSFDKLSPNYYSFKRQWL